MTDAETIAMRFLRAVHEPGNDPGPHRLSTACVQVLPVDRAAIMVHTGDRAWELLGASDPTAADYAQVQVAAGEGPGPQAYDTDAPVLVPDYSAVLGKGHWPLLAAVKSRPTGAVFAFPLHLGAIRLGTLDLYTDTPTPLDRTGLAAAAQVAELVTVVLLSALQTRGPHAPTNPDDTNNHTANGLSSWWEPAPSTREIHQATGMVAAQLRTDIATAYARLVAHAVATARPLATIAADVLARRLRLPADHDTGPDSGNGNGNTP